MHFYEILFPTELLCHTQQNEQTRYLHGQAYNLIHVLICTKVETGFSSFCIGIDAEMRQTNSKKRAESEEKRRISRWTEYKAQSEREKTGGEEQQDSTKE